MTDVDMPPKQTFRLSQLIYDTRYRSLTIQVVVFMLFMAGAAWLVDNTIQNLKVLGKDFNFGFLWNRAGYDIGQTLIPYTNDSTHFRAMLVGLLNTLLVSFLGCVAATVIGIFVGVLRLSSNWLVARLMTLYVEVFRNVPLLLWILVIYAIFTEVMPVPNAFRVNPATGEAAASMLFFDTVALTNRYTAIPGVLFSNPLPGILGLAGPLWSALVALAGGLFLNSRLKARATRIQEATGTRPSTWWATLLLLTLPWMAVLWAQGFHLDVPAFNRFNFQGGIKVTNALVVLWLALSLYTGAFVAEIVRAGIMAISKGQTEAAAALGLRPGRIMSLVILPQALRVIIPPLISQFLNLTKNSSLAIAVGYMDLRGTLGGITLNQTGRELEAILLMMGLYLAISLGISGVMNVYNNAVKLKER
ncbi:amino acid ABC transporter permease [Phaeovulum vinaykumarii]|uniref:L-glutamine ABC transporter membrane protein /L-glutamate ABC transporter membrane protein /L-aspartate ABC transporter membrane protein /L-asparagine ABC transporter membrane protein n=1 Tax=Phaeovulum vinaykumarii TaxID=407234 RepID=A0A1N7L5H0_9RHOB|nr:ABC transporter permease subunit [Phaeovulum vinaykumarii]SIS68930.1 L-glutamine ABC transporter membrane protein /L-glutamate ABC transporter membrane protein /L-aspartate ABC transporter membrane protein /L-asparagine ABC transporter membrane protein [Phaeovulum vinaykumarii]SOB99768.1 L-glutamine ABC transporter membrane protein /L-glutamate ABC transporter membrane protein /L-aspartate ABC transporter membrane protein /L-asparagine ABC transporter membrane protein [Phaeovulum vinaykumarii]